MEMVKKTKRRWIILGTLLAVLLLLHLVPPYFLKKYLNEVLSDLNGYEGRIEDVDFHLYRGAFVINNLTIERSEGNMREAFINIESIDLSIHWKSLLHSSFTGEIITRKPVINFGIDESGEISQTGKEHNWDSTIREITPLNISLNQFVIEDGTIQYSDYSKDPEVQLKIENLHLTAANLANVLESDSTFPSDIHMEATTTGGGKLQMDAQANIMISPPDFNAKLDVQGVALTGLRNFTEAYANFDFDEGELSIYIEILLKDGKYTGYLKPILENARIIKAGEEEENGFLRNLWEGFLSVFALTIENHNKEQLATKIPIEGSLNDNDSNIPISLANLLGNAFFKAIPKNHEGYPVNKQANSTSAK